jgi:hypothetical protein
MPSMIAMNSADAASIQKAELPVAAPPAAEKEKGE